jgi:hypothetical protein
MSIAHSQLPATGTLSVVVNRCADEDRDLVQRLAARRKGLVRDDTIGHFRAERAGLLYDAQRFTALSPQQRLLAWLRDHVSPSIPRAWYKMVLGHDIHVSMWAELYVSHFHATEPDPFTGRIGWTENLGLVSTGKVTNAFRDFEALMLVTDATTYGDFKFHEVGTGTTAEANTQTALVTPSGIARVSGTQTNPSANTYQSVATVTADTTETWEEHGIFNASTSGTMMDRSLISPTVPVVASDTATFTYVLTKNAEA